MQFLYSKSFLFLCGIVAVATLTSSIPFFVKLVQSKRVMVLYSATGGNSGSNSGSQIRRKNFPELGKSIVNFTATANSNSFVNNDTTREVCLSDVALPVTYQSLQKTSPINKKGTHNDLSELGSRNNVACTGTDERFNPKQNSNITIEVLHDFLVKKQLLQQAKSHQPSQLYKAPQQLTPRLSPFLKTNITTNNIIDRQLREEFNSFNE